MTESDLRYLRYAIMIAERAWQHGSPPFGAILVSSRGWILSEGENTQGATSDCTCHAETNLLHEATRRYSRRLLAHSTMYTSAEPCPMCAGAIFWSGVGRVVFGLSSEHLYALTQNKAEHLFEHCADVLAKGTHRVEVCGPMLEDEAESIFRKTVQSQQAAVN
jgi:tRNA(Arg) A34 adenosine deaminase TadA